VRLAEAQVAVAAQDAPKDVAMATEAVLQTLAMAAGNAAAGRLRVAETRNRAWPLARASPTPCAVAATWPRAWPVARASPTPCAAAATWPRAPGRHANRTQCAPVSI